MIIGCIRWSGAGRCSWDCCGREQLLLRFPEAVLLYKTKWKPRYRCVVTRSSLWLQGPSVCRRNAKGVWWWSPRLGLFVYSKLWTMQWNASSSGILEMPFLRCRVYHNRRGGLVCRNVPGLESYSLRRRSTFPCNPGYTAVVTYAAVVTAARRNQ